MQNYCEYIYDKRILILTFNKIVVFFLQWSNNIWKFWGIKLCLLAYWLVCFIIDFAVGSQTRPLYIDNWWTFLTNWGITLILIYFLSSFCLVTYGITSGNKHSKKRTSGAKLNDASTGTTVVIGNQNIVVEPKLGSWYRLKLNWNEKCFTC